MSPVLEVDSAEAVAVAKLSDAEVLNKVGKLGPGVVGRALFDRAQKIRARDPDGRLGPAILDADYAAKQLAQRKSDQPTTADRDDEESTGDPVDEDDAPPADPWAWTSLSGAKQLAQTKGVNYKPGIKRKDLIDALVEAGVAPPAPPDDEKHEDEE